MEKLPTHLLAKASEHRLQAALSPAATIGDLLELADRWQSGFEIDLGSWSLRLDEHEKENKIRYHGWGEHYTYYALSFLPADYEQVCYRPSEIRSQPSGLSS